MFFLHLDGGSGELFGQLNEVEVTQSIMQIAVAPYSIIAEIMLNSFNVDVTQSSIASAMTQNTTTIEAT